MYRFTHAVLAPALALLAGCSSPSLDTTNFSCESDADCDAGKVCGIKSGASICLTPNTDDLIVGMSAPLQGASQDLGIDMRRGIEAMFARANSEGGIFGRQLRLTALNDNYDPALALANTKLLLDIEEEVPDLEQPDVRGEDSVLALLGSVGTPPTLATAPIATKNKTVLFAPLTGAQKYLRDGNSPYVYNLRAGYNEETQAIIEYLERVRTPRVFDAMEPYKRLIAFTQRDAFGDAGYVGLVNAYNSRIGTLPQPDSALPNPSIARVQYERDNLTSVDAAITQTQQLLRSAVADSPTKPSVAIVMVDTYAPGNKFIRAIKDWLNADRSRAEGIDVTFIHLSFVGADALVKALSSTPDGYTDVVTEQSKKYAEGVLVTQVVPYYQGSAPGLVQYRSDIQKLDMGAPSFTSLEGYLAAKLFVEALRKNGAAVTSESLVRTLDTKIVDVDLGVGVQYNFSALDHQASDTVWGSEIQANGTFKIPFVWDPDTGIVTSSN